MSYRFRIVLMVWIAGVTLGYLIAKVLVLTNQDE